MESVEFNTKKIGVFADTSNGMLELIYDKIGGFSFSGISESTYSRMPKASGVNFYYVNVPEAEIAESEMFWTSSYKLRAKEFPYYDPVEPETLKTAIESVKDNVYKIRSNELQNKKNGFIVLKIKMPYGTADRFYPIKIE